MAVCLSKQPQNYKLFFFNLVVTEIFFAKLFTDLYIFGQ